MSLNIREDISLKSPVVATVKHGDELDVLSVRRRFMRVRAANGAEGWVDSEKLITTEQMEGLRSMSEVAAKLPVQAQATVYDARNVHTEPHRQAPSFALLKEEERFFVLGHKLVERKPYQSEVTKEIEKSSTPPPRKRKKSAKVAKTPKPRVKDDVELPAMPAPPPVPADWQRISFRLPVEEPAPEPAAAKEDKSGLSLILRPPKEPPKHEEWSLIRLLDGRAGWILTRSMTMTIPDEVAKYAEGHRITSWFELGEVRDGELTKKHYLWTTISKNGEPYEFDGYRVFVYNARRHRYETGARAKDIRGYFPGAVHPVQLTEGKKTYTATGFSLVMEDENGALVRKTFSFEGYRIRLLSTSPWTRLEDPFDLKALAITRPAGESPKAEPGFFEKLKSKMPWSKKT